MESASPEWKHCLHQSLLHWKTCLDINCQSAGDILRFGQRLRTVDVVLRTTFDGHLLKAYLLVAVVSLFQSFAHSICVEADAKLCGYEQSVAAAADCMSCTV